MPSKHSSESSCHSKSSSHSHHSHHSHHSEKKHCKLAILPNEQGVDIIYKLFLRIIYDCNLLTISKCVLGDLTGTEFVALTREVYRTPEYAVFFRARVTAFFEKYADKLCGTYSCDPIWDLHRVYVNPSQSAPLDRILSSTACPCVTSCTSVVNNSFAAALLISSIMVSAENIAYLSEAIGSDDTQKFLEQYIKISESFQFSCFAIQIIDAYLREAKCLLFTPYPEST